MSVNELPLPAKKSWKTASLNELGQLYCGQSPASSTVNGNGIGTLYVSGPEQWDGHKIRQDKWTTDPKRFVPDGCIFITVKGAGVGKIFPGISCTIGRDIYAFKPKDELSAKFIEHAIRFTVQDVLRHAVGDIPGLSKAHILQHEIGIPSPQEQERIVAEIEKQFSRLDEAVANLKRVKANLKRYKVSVLKAAVEGKLTTGTNMVVPTAFSELIEGLSQGWSPKCELSRDPLPNEWAIIKTTAVQSMRYLDSESKPLPSKFAPRSNIEIKAGDFLMTRKGPRQRAGVACLVRKTRSRLMVCDTVYRFRCKESRVIPAYLELALNSPLIVSEIDRRKSGISDSGVSLTHDKLGSVLVPIPQLAEQEWIVAEVERRLSVIDELEAAVEANLTRADRLRQSILSQAFIGKLVPAALRERSA